MPYQWPDELPDFAARQNSTPLIATVRLVDA